MTRATLFDRTELSFETSVHLDFPYQEAYLLAEFKSPSGMTFKRDGFWDGGTNWKVRFMPREEGMHEWRVWSDVLQIEQRGRFHVEKVDQFPSDFAEFGPIRVSKSRTHFEHANGSPFLFVSDTCWYGAMRATDTDWNRYVEKRVEQGFTAVQFMASNWWGFSDDGSGEKIFEIAELVKPNLRIFQRLDQRIRSLNANGLLAVPAMLWSAVWHDEYVEKGSAMKNPGNALSEEQAIKIERYMVARWGADHVLWLINGDGVYTGEQAQRWNRIGRAVFGDDPHRAPVSQHHCGVSWTDPAMQNETWLDMVGYQSGHGDSKHDVEWLTQGPPATKYKDEPKRVVINLEPCYEGHSCYESKLPASAFTTRRAMIWSLMASPTAGTSYGAHGVWGWDTGEAPPEGHASTGTPPAWHEAFDYEGGHQVGVIRAIFESLDWHELVPRMDLLKAQPNPTDHFAYVMVSADAFESHVLVYVPKGGKVQLSGLQKIYHGKLVSPRNGQEFSVHGDIDKNREISMPRDEDWFLVLKEAYTRP